MKTLELEQFGVQELDAVEIKTIDGGLILKLMIGHIHGFLDGIKGNADWDWAWQ